MTDCKTAGKIFFVMGKSASGKDTIYKKLLEYFPELKTVTLYTTRPMREGETEGGIPFYKSRTAGNHEVRGTGD